MASFRPSFNTTSKFRQIFSDFRYSPFGSNSSFLQNTGKHVLFLCIGQRAATFYSLSNSSPYNSTCLKSLSKLLKQIIRKFSRRVGINDAPFRREMVLSPYSVLAFTLHERQLAYPARSPIANYGPL